MHVHDLVMYSIKLSAVNMLKWLEQVRSKCQQQIMIKWLTHSSRAHCNLGWDEAAANVMVFALEVFCPQLGCGE